MCKPGFPYAPEVSLGITIDSKANIYMREMLNQIHLDPSEFTGTQVN